MKKFILLFLLISSKLFSQQIERYWNESSNLNVKSFESTYNNGFIVVGNAQILFGQNYYSAGMVLYRDSSGLNSWERVYTSFDNTFSFESIVQLTDSGFIAGGTMFNPMTNQFGGAILKLDKNGNEVWKKTIQDGTGDELLISDLEIINDSSFYLLASKKASADGAFIIKMDTSGTLIWQKSFEYMGLGKIELHGMSKLANGELILAGGKYSETGLEESGVLIRLDTSGNVVWTYRNSQQYSCFTDVKADSTSLYCRNLSDNGINDVVSFDYSGNYRWNFHTNESDLMWWMFPKTRRTLEFGSDSNIYIYYGGNYGIYQKITRQGIKLDEFTILGSAQGIDFTENGKCLLLVSGPSIGVKSVDYSHFAVEKLDSFSYNNTMCGSGYNTLNSENLDSLVALNLVPSTSCSISSAMMENVTLVIYSQNSCVELLGSIEENSNSNFEIFPNPARNLVKITLNSDNNFPLEGFLMDAFGKEVMRFCVQSTELSLDISSLKPGLYWVKMGSTHKKIIIE